MDENLFRNTFFAGSHIYSLCSSPFFGGYLMRLSAAQPFAASARAALCLSEMDWSNARTLS